MSFTILVFKSIICNWKKVCNNVPVVLWVCFCSFSSKSCLLNFRWVKRDRLREYWVYMMMKISFTGSRFFYQTAQVWHLHLLTLNLECQWRILLTWWKRNMRKPGKIVSCPVRWGSELIGIWLLYLISSLTVKRLKTSFDSRSLSPICAI